jgi:hypothetical protein
MKDYLSAILLAIRCVGCGQTQAVGTVSQKDNTVKQLRGIIGITHINEKYHLTNKDFLSEGADRILGLGSRVIKVWFHKPWDCFYGQLNLPHGGSYFGCG